MIFRQLFDAESSTYTYLLADEETREAVLIDPVLEQVERDLGLVGDLELVLRFALDTHVHADHVTGCGRLRERTGCKTVLSARAGVGCADLPVHDGDLVRFGRYSLEVRETPGHTSGCVSYVLADRTMAFTGDALLIRGCGRTDFQQGDAHVLYRSVHGKLLSLPGSTLIMPGHDYRGRTASSVDEEKRLNPRLGGGKSEEQFVAIMAGLQLALPKKIDVAVPANLQCGVPRGVPVSPEPAGDARQWAPIERTDAGVPEVPPEWVASPPVGIRVVDVREPDETAGELGRIPGSTLAPLATLLDRAALWSPGDAVVLVCRSGKRSGEAATRLERTGFDRVASMRGGMFAWRERRLPVEGGAPFGTDAAATSDAAPSAKCSA